MGPRILAYRIALFTLLREIQFSLSQMLQEPLAAAYVPVFQAIRAGWQTVLLAEIGILDALSQAHAAVHKADRALDAFAGKVSRAVDDNTDGLSRKQLRASLFKNKSLSRFRRPVLSGQLLAMTDWSTKLATCGVPALAALAPTADALVAEGKAAADLLTKAQNANRDFRDIGARKQFIDSVNAGRQDAHGGLAKLPFQNPALAQDFAEGFFYAEPPRDQEETIDEVKTSIQDLQGQLEERQALLKKLEDDAAAETKAEQARKEEEQSAAALEAQAEELLKQAAALKAKAKK